jgi:recombination protein RecT
VSAQVVYEKDHFVWNLGFDEDVEHNPPRAGPAARQGDRRLCDGGPEGRLALLEVMSLEEIEKVRAVSRAGQRPWVTWWGEMARKTVMRRLSKRLPMSTDRDDFDASSSATRRCRA